MKKIDFLAVIIVFVFCKNAFAWDDKIVHPKLTQAAIEKSELHDYLREYLNLPQGMETEIVTDSVQNWIKKGSHCEDVPDCRASNHFHNPRKDWKESCMSDESWVINDVKPIS